jgi:bifunctional non-homologous end joining protein LigD
MSGRVGTGFSHKLSEDLFRRLDAMTIPKSPFAKKLSALDARRVRFVRPELVAEVEFGTWTAEGLIVTHRSAEEVVLEAKVMSG